MKKINLILVAVFVPLAGVVFVGCEKESEIGSEKNYIIENSTEDKSNIIILGEQLNDPYKLENMQKAYENLKCDIKAQLEPTHKYIRFLPENQDELTILNSDTN